MKKLIMVLLAVAPSLGFSALVPLTEFDQSKLENILRRIPASEVRSEQRDGFVRKHHLFKLAGAELKCSADYYGSAPVPSFKRCEVRVDEKTVQREGDEWRVEIKDPKTAGELFQALSFGVTEKKVYSTERIYGQAYEGEHRKLFRYVFSCEESSCRITFASR